MNAGSIIDFFNKKAEELKSEEKPVEATSSESSPDTKTDCSISVKIEDKKPTEQESDSSISTDNISESTKDNSDSAEEKTAASTKDRVMDIISSAKDKATEIASNAGRPTGTGIAAGVGLGTIMAALGATARAENLDKSKSIWTNPVLLGTIGAASGYLGGNSLDKVPEKSNSSSTILPLALDIGGIYGLGHIGRVLADRDDINKLEDLEASQREITNSLNRFTRRKLRSSINAAINRSRGKDNLKNIARRDANKMILDRNGNLRDVYRNLLSAENSRVNDDILRQVDDITLRRNSLKKIIDIARRNISQREFARSQGIPLHTRSIVDRLRALNPFKGRAGNARENIIDQLSRITEAPSGSAANTTAGRRALSAARMNRLMLALGIVGGGHALYTTGKLLNKARKTLLGDD